MKQAGLKEASSGAATESAAAAPGRTPEQAKNRVALVSVGAACGMLVAKLLVGLHAHSLGILAESAHSGLDLVATLFTMISIRIAARPADANHPFGHGKFENFSAFLETGLLVFTAAAIATAALQGWVRHGAEAAVRLDGWAFGVMVVSIGVDGARAHWLGRAAAHYGSDALAADALNFGSDMVTGMAVLLGLGLVAAGQRWQVGWLRHADAVAACGVAVAMVWLALRLGRRTAGVLLDEAPEGLSESLRAALQGVEGVADLERLRLRKVGSRYFVDLRVGMEKAATLERARLVRDEVAGRIQRELPEADVVVETEPQRRAPQGPLDEVQAIARRHDLHIHDLSIYDLGAELGHGLNVEFHLELDAALPLAVAHNLVSRLEAEMRNEVPAIRQILTHIEPASAAVSAAIVVDQQRMARRVEQLAAQVAGLLDCHDIQILRASGHLGLSCHCSFPDDMPVNRVHELATGLEMNIKRALPELYRVTIHPEPGSDNRR